MTERDVAEALHQAYRDAWPERTGPDATPFLELVATRGLTDDVPEAVLDLYVGWWRDGVKPRRVGRAAASWTLSSAFSIARGPWSVSREVSFQPRKPELPDNCWFVSFGEPDDPEAFDRVDRDALDVVDAVVEPNDGAASIEQRLRRTRPLDRGYGCFAWFVAREAPGSLDAMVRDTCVGRVTVPAEVWESILRMQRDEGLWSDGSLWLHEAPGSQLEAQVTFRTT